jgi:hypothetical protein
MLQATLAEYYLRVQQASPDEPVIIPSAHWVRADHSRQPCMLAELSRDRVC